MRHHFSVYIIYFTALLLLLFSFWGCAGNTADTKETAASAEGGKPGSTTSRGDPDNGSGNSDTDTGKDNFKDKLALEKETDFYGDYQETGGAVALVIDKSSIDDNGFNQEAYEGAKTYADAAGVSYSYYSAKENTQEAFENVIRHAVENNAKLVICAGSHFEQAVGLLQDTFPDVNFLLLDGVPRDDSGRELPISPNVHCITYHQEEAGYLAGFMAVYEGYRSLGFIGGEQLAAVEQYGAGYVRGISDASEILGVKDDITVNYWYTGTFNPDRSIEENAVKWYSEGTEIIFACGGSIYQSVLAAAKQCDTLLIGVDKDQSSISERFLTSAMKGVKPSVIVALDEYFACGSEWPSEMAGKEISYGAAEKCAALPVTEDAWRFKKATLEDYYQILTRMRNGELSIPTDSGSVQEASVNVIYHNN